MVTERVPLRKISVNLPKPQDRPENQNSKCQQCYQSKSRKTGTLQQEGWMIQGNSQKDGQQHKGSQSKYAEIPTHAFVAFCLYQRVTVDFRCIGIFRNKYEKEMGKRCQIFPAKFFVKLYHFRRRCPHRIGNGFQTIADRGRSAFFKLTERQKIAYFFQEPAFFAMSSRKVSMESGKETGRKVGKYKRCFIESPSFCL